MTSLRDAAREVIAEADGLGCGAMIGSDNPMEHALGVLVRALSADRGEAAPYLCGGTRFKLTAGPRNACYSSFPAELGGKWVALVDATDNRHMQATPPAPAESAEGAAAPSGVSDAMVERFNDSFAVHAGADTHDDRLRIALTAALEAAQPQPGRVEGMDQ